MQKQQRKNKKKSDIIADLEEKIDLNKKNLGCPISKNIKNKAENFLENTKKYMT